MQGDHEDHQWRDAAPIAGKEGGRDSSMTKKADRQAVGQKVQASVQFTNSRHEVLRPTDGGGSAGGTSSVRGLLLLSTVIVDRAARSGSATLDLQRHPAEPTTIEPPSH